MKKTILITFVAVFFSSVIAQSKKVKVIPQKITEAFSSKYPAIKIKKWRQNDEMYVAQFSLDMRKHYIFYSADGSWIKTETKIRWSWNLPKNIESAFYKSNFASYLIHDIKEVQTPTEHFYELLVNDGNRLDSDHQQFAEDFVVDFRPDGTIIKKEVLN